MDSVDWIGPDESMRYPAFDRWLEKEGLVDRCSVRVNTVYGMLSAAKAGLGLTVLPCYLAETTSGWSESARRFHRWPPISGFSPILICEEPNASESFWNMWRGLLEGRDSDCEE